jgi:transposase
VLQAPARRARLDKTIVAMAASSEYTPVVRRSGCLRGVSTLTAFGLAVEVGAWDRLTGSTIGAPLGLVPTESSSGQSRSQGSITKTGSTYAGRLLVEVVVPPQALPAPGARMRVRWGLAPGGSPGPRTRR